MLRVRQTQYKDSFLVHTQERAALDQMRNKAQVKKQMLILAMKMALEKTGLLGGDKVL